MGSLKKKVSMKDYQSQLHVKWEYKYPIVWCPKYRRKKLYGKLRRRFGKITYELYCQKGVQFIEGHVQLDHVRLCLVIPPKYSVSSKVGLNEKTVRDYIKHQELSNKRQLNLPKFD